MNNLEYIAANLSDEDILCQIAEEAAELAKAALKLRRAITGTNPTPMSEEEAMVNFIEEYGDVMAALEVFSNKTEDDEYIGKILSDNVIAKLNRWAQRIKEGKKHE